MAGIGKRALQAALAATLLAGGSAFAATAWKAIDLGTPGLISRAAAVSNAGHVVGCAERPDGSSNAFLWFEGRMRDLGKGDASTTGQACATAVNDAGVAAGHTPTGDLVIWNPDGSVRPMGLRGAVNDMNSAGAIVGSFESEGKTRAFLWRDGAVTEIGVVDATDAFAYGTATGVNDGGQVSGTLNGSGFFYANGVLRPIPELSLGNDINGRGEIVGMAATGPPGGPWVGIWRDGRFEIFPEVGQTSGIAINTPGRALGDAEGLHGFVIQGGGWQRLQWIPEVVALGWGRMEPADISDRGWIVGAAADSAFVLIPIASQDVDGDSRSDLTFAAGPVQDATEYRLWLMAGLQKAGETALHVPDGEALHSIADFNGDGKQDYLWAHASGAYRVELRNGSDSLGTRVVLDGGSTAWKVVGHGDFNGDGRQDLLWRHRSGSPGLWLMDGTTILAAGGLPSPGSGYEIAHAADFDADGKSDIAWRHADGRVVISLMDGFAERAASTPISATAAWSPVHAADLDGDGRRDLVWRHTNGTYGIWMMNGTAASHTATVLAGGGGWELALSGDLSGDGKADLVWKHADGRHGAWLMDGAAIMSTGLILGAGTGWSAVSARDLDGNGTGDLVWRHAGGAVGAWLMNGMAVMATGSLSSGGLRLVP